MATPFKPPPRHDASSSPFPSLDEMWGITKPSREPEELARSSWNHTPQPASHVASFPATKQTPIDLVTPARLPTEPIHDEEDGEDSVQVIRIPAPGTKRGRRKAGSGKLREAKPKQPKPPTGNGNETPDDKPGKKAKAGQSKNKTRKASEVRSHYFPEVKPSKSSKSTKSNKSNKSNGDQAEGPAPKVADADDDADAPLELPPASKRRMDWTPPPSDKLITIGSASSDIREMVSSAAKYPGNDTSNEAFGNFLAKYGREEEQIGAAVAGCLEGIPEIFKKRKKTAVVPDDPSVSGTDASPTKKAPKKKKARTITEAATALYARRDESEQEPPTASILDYVEQQATEGTAGAKGPKKPGRKPTRRKKGKKESPEPVLLSPNTAIQEVSKQSFVFGTSSQLAREQSPTVLRDLQTAIRLSNEEAEARENSDPFASPIHSDAVEPKPRRKLWGVGARDEDGGLLDLELIDLVNTPMANSSLPDDDPFGYVVDGQHAMSSRIEVSSTTDDESFPEMDILSKDAPRRPGVKGVWSEKLASSGLSFPSASSSASRDASRPSAITTTTATIDAGSDMTQLCTPPYSGQAVCPSQASVSTLPATPKQDTSSKVPGPATQTSRAAEATAAAGSGVPPKPKYDLYTDSQLSREITSYGFKPVKRRAAMLALLDQCWESKHKPRVALNPLPSNKSLSTSSQQQRKEAAASEPTKATSTQPPAKRPRGRPRKDSSTTKDADAVAKPKSQAKAGSGAKVSVSKTTGTTASKTEPVAPQTPKRRAAPKPKAQSSAEVIEIPDSASDSSAALTCSPEGSFSSPGGVDMSLSLDEKTETSLVSGAAVDQQQSALMRHITKAVTEAAPTKDPSQPSWHEKMLMYDPVILEDLAAWLNSGQLTRVGYDGEVSAWEVKQWWVVSNNTGLRTDLGKILGPAMDLKKLKVLRLGTRTLVLVI
ncbi:hypothetical protein ACRALDRAFT_1080756 [Sodiomyces alcalophilus JCM 7366]|uniref:uncharacterized protein n=1 Tax=Sodiomyces alcalophilus JCM 7366 TaxID=591952 RepID=UPI0039B45A7B